MGEKGYEYAFGKLALAVIEALVPDFPNITRGLGASQIDFNGRQAVTMDGYRHLGQ